MHGPVRCARCQGGFAGADTQLRVRLRMWLRIIIGAYDDIHCGLDNVRVLLKVGHEHALRQRRAHRHVWWLCSAGPVVLK